ncbi:phosphotransferase enzyme family protein [Corynebacterium simulans]|nr:phosphotransferase enzyme family protein [Corynebacterium simulans]
MAQLVAHHTGSVGVTGSNPVSSTDEGRHFLWRPFLCFRVSVTRTVVGMETFNKRVRTADQAGAEAAGLRWLAQARSDVVVEVVGVGERSISTRRVAEARPTANAAQAFGRALREVHASGADAFGAAPEGWTGRNYIGRVEQECRPVEHWGDFYVHQRVLPFVEANGALDEGYRDVVKRTCDAVLKRHWDGCPARIHGDLWAGNVLFTADSAVMIDPAAHGGHPLTDLAMLDLFGVPYLDDIYRGYGLAPDEKRWFPLHQLHPLAVHALTHGVAYHRALGDAAHAALELLEG